MDHVKSVSVITIVLNDPADFKKTGSSVLAQNYPDIEWIVVDGGSADGTAEEIRKHESKISHWISEPDRGIYDAMNKGLAKATGDWVNFMNAGDTFNSLDTVSKVMAYDLEGSDVVYGDSIAAYPHSQILLEAGKPEEMIRGMIFCHQSVFVRRELIRNNGFDLSFPVAADFKMFYGLFAAGYKFKKLPIPVAVFDSSGLSNRRMVQSAREHFTILKKHRRLNLQQRIYHLGFIFWVGLVSLGYRILPAKLVQNVRGKVRWWQGDKVTR
jgi:glycosyltransferase involved in cell wall biosynthesis